MLIAAFGRTMTLLRMTLVSNVKDANPVKQPS